MREELRELMKIYENQEREYKEVEEICFSYHIHAMKRYVKAFDNRAEVTMKMYELRKKMGESL